uniref:Uncharacterized protein n=1 Tax=Amphimedon queenslandica TaxID=400682 RepID=A0A1X7T9U2_AMPQE
WYNILYLCTSDLSHTSIQKSLDCLRKHCVVSCCMCTKQIQYIT